VAESLVDRLQPEIAPGDRVLVARAAETRDVLVRELRALGAVVDEVPAYRTRAAGAGRGLRSSRRAAGRRRDVHQLVDGQNLCALPSGRARPADERGDGGFDRADHAGDGGGFGLDTRHADQYTIPARSRRAAYFAEGRS
jgi:hypothetical protein